MIALLLTTSLVLHGAGATFPEPAYRRWFAEYERTHSGVHFEYDAVGSGEGARRLAAGAVDFAASDPPLSDAQLAAERGVVHLPAFVGGVAVAYRLPGAQLRLTPRMLAAIFTGKVARWSDAALAPASAGPLPDLPIKVVTRADESGSTQVFTVFLSGLDAPFAGAVGAGKLVRWPVGAAMAGSDQLAAALAAAEGAIGYVELTHARAAGLQVAALQNAAGAFVEPTLRSLSRAAVGVKVPGDLRVSLVNPAGPEAYPLSTFTYLLYDPGRLPAPKLDALASFFKWALHEGQPLVEESGNARLPGLIVLQAESLLAQPLGARQR